MFNFCSGTLEVNCSKDLKIQGVIGPCTSLEKVSIYCLVKNFFFFFKIQAELR